MNPLLDYGISIRGFHNLQLDSKNKTLKTIFPYTFYTCKTSI